MKKRGRKPKQKIEEVAIIKRGRKPKNKVEEVNINNELSYKNDCLYEKEEDKINHKIETFVEFTTKHGGVESIPSSLVSELKTYLGYEHEVTLDFMIEKIEHRIIGIFNSGKSSNYKDAIALIVESDV